ncbi:uncharacterized protein LOC107404197 [Ziziphus jujuba]|uniref:Uncharacterized protein LOC107404197 n=1 Tax=Ziziphus jujuba TaxID=326968 RepID=A0ABM3ID93_ZIZJJ|nr:uncharacterized protein LOC107404197 [Ziziphus jujuba]
MKFQNIVGAVLRLIFAAGGLILLFHGSFSKIQFEDHASLKGTCFIILSLGVGFFVYKPLECNDMFEKLRTMHFLVGAVVKLLLLGLFSMVIFFTKYPGLKLHHSEGKRSRKVYDLLGVGSFSVFALVISWERRHGGGEGFGVFEYMLELTMDASMEIPAGHEDGSGPNLWYMVGAYVYCFLLLIIRSYGNSLSNSAGQQDTLLLDQNENSLSTEQEIRSYGNSLDNSVGQQDTLLRDQNGNSSSTEQEISDLELGLRNRRRLQEENYQLISDHRNSLSNSVGQQDTLLRDQNGNSLSTEQEIRSYGNSLSNSVGQQDTLLRDQTGNSLSTEQEISNLELGLRNRRRNRRSTGIGGVVNKKSGTWS